MTIDHTLSWEVARAGGMLAYVLASASVLIGMLVSLKLRSPAWPRFLTTELHRFVTVLALLFTAIHGLAVWMDPFTGFTPAEVLLPTISHYRPLWVALGIVGGYLLLAVWASEYVRPWIGYAWWRRLHYAAFAVFALATLHGIGTGSDTTEPWALAIYGLCSVGVLVLLGWRFLSGRISALRLGASVLAGAAVAGLAVFTVAGPAQGGWNAIANNGNGQGASAAWQAAHPATPTAPTASFDADLTASFTDDGRLAGSFSGPAAGSFELRVGRSAAILRLVLEDGWACSGAATGNGSDILAACRAADGTGVEVDLSALREVEDGRVLGRIAVGTGQQSD
jgi:hypothetical protein